MTVDERLNEMEDRLRIITDAINHNNKITRDALTRIGEQLKYIQAQIDEMKVKNKTSVFDDIFGNHGKKK